ncbi:MAG: VCBS repeat-containing protein [Candidatus Angelobacter sp.]
MKSASLRSVLVPLTSASLCAALALMMAALVFATPGNAQVSFQPTTHSSPNLPNDVFIADLNNDGKPDVIATQGGSNMVSVFLNNGSGIPAGPSGTFLTGGVSTASVVTGDFNEDGFEDIATANCGNSPDPPQTPVPSSVSILFNAGGGTSFQPHQDYPLPACPDTIGRLTASPESLFSLVVSYRQSTITLLMNNGLGQFTERTIAGPPNTFLGGVSAADYNGDGLDDIAAVMDTSGSSVQQVVIFFQHPDGSFGPATPIFSSNSGLISANTVGFNASGRPDLLVPFTPAAGVNQPAGVFALINNGGGNFSSIELDVDHRYSVGSKAAEGDLQNNGLHSIILPVNAIDSANALFGAFAIFIQQSKGAFLGPFYFMGNNGGAPNRAAVADFNGDGRPDFVAADFEVNNLEVFLNTTTASTCPFFSGGAGVHVCTPAPGSSAPSPVAIGASGSGGTFPIVALKAYIDGIQVAASDTNTLNAAVAKATGNHQLAVNAWDVNDVVRQTIVNFTVGGTAACSVPASAGIHICAPTQGSTVHSPVAVSAAANGGTAKISAMKAYIDGKQVAASGSGSISGSAAEAVGTHKLTVNAWNTAGKLFQSTATFTVH